MEAPKEEKSNLASWLPYILIPFLVFVLPVIQRWVADDEPVTGIGISFEEVVEKSKLVVTDVYKNTPAFKSGLQKGDVIVEINGKKVVVASELPKFVKSLSAGSEINPTVLRDNRKINIATEVAVLKRKDYK